MVPVPTQDGARSADVETALPKEPLFGDPIVKPVSVRVTTEPGAMDAVDEVMTNCVAVIRVMMPNVL